jgi:DNA helicase-2/ATP-dependent DNA helicase PcrA
LHHTDLAKMVLDESGYTAMWQADKSPDAEGRLENLTELVNAMQDFDTLQGFLEHISLVMDGDYNNEQGEVTLMTLHAAKGLEFDTVFMPGWEEGIFPSQRTIDENGAVGLEEERRLAYVGITRARKRVYLSFAGSRRIHGQWHIYSVALCAGITAGNRHRRRRSGSGRGNSLWPGSAGTACRRWYL